jgi:hypothetical protein
MPEILRIDPHTLRWTIRETRWELNMANDQEQRTRAIELLELLAEWLRSGGISTASIGERYGRRWTINRSPWRRDRYP